MGFCTHCGIREDGMGHVCQPPSADKEKIAALKTNLEVAHERIRVLERENFNLETRALAAENAIRARTALSLGNPILALVSGNPNPNPTNNNNNISGAKREVPEKAESPEKGKPKKKAKTEPRPEHSWENKTFIADEKTYPSVIKFVRDGMLPLYKPGDQPIMSQNKFKLDYEDWRSRNGGPHFETFTSANLLVATLPSFTRHESSHGHSFLFNYDEVKAFFDEPSPFAGMRIVDKNDPFPIPCLPHESAAIIQRYLQDLVDNHISFSSSKPMNVYTSFMRWCIHRKIDQIMSYMTFSKEMRRLAPGVFKIEDTDLRGVRHASFNHTLYVPVDAMLALQAPPGAVPVQEDPEDQHQDDQ
jgi:hypothetical protein